MFLFVQSFAVFAGHNDAKTDSLRKAISTSAHDTSRVKTLFALGNLFIDGPSDSLLFYYNKALHIVEENIKSNPSKGDIKPNAEYGTFKALQLRALIELGIEYFYRSEYNKALEYYFVAAETARELEDFSHLSECYGEIGIVYKNQGKYDEALKYQMMAIDIKEAWDEPDWIAICNNNIGNIYKAKGFYDIAIDYYLKALKTFEEMNQSRRVAATLHSIGDLFFEQKNMAKALEYFNETLVISMKTGDRLRESNVRMAIGDVRAQLGDYKAARNSYFTAIHLFDSLGWIHSLDDAYKSIGITYLEQQLTDSASWYFDKALEISIHENDQSNLAGIYGKKGLLLLIEGKYSQALKSTEQSIAMAKLTGSPALLMDGYLNLYQIWEKLGNSKNALNSYVLYAAIKDSLFRADQYRAITEMEFKYGTEKKEQNIALLTEQNKVQELVISRRNRLLWSALVLFVFVITGGYFYYQNRRLKAGQKASELENRLLRAQMNPHFIFNSLIAIQGFIYEKNPVEAGDFLAKFADLVRLTLENSRTEFVLLQKEIGMLRVYLELQQLRYEGKFNFKIEPDESIDPANIKIPPMLAQPFIENAVEHGMRHKPEKGNISIKLLMKGKDIQVSVEDDGVGRDVAMKLRKKEKPQSLAIAITRDRLKVLSKKYGRRFDFKITDLFDNENQACGTRVEFTMPVEVA